MNVLVDTNILGRMAEPAHAHHQAALAVTSALRTRGETPAIVPQVLYEFWATATRPRAANGLGLSATEAAAEIARLKSLFAFLPDSAAIYPEWERLVILYQVKGKNAHDARLIAAMAVRGITHLLTFNTADFARFQGVTALDPFSLAAAPPPPP
jgi:predicted nucleic acid-binding protein